MSHQQARVKLQSVSISHAGGQQRGMLQRACACGRAAGPTGECADCRRKRGLGGQAKQQISRPGDRYEQEADRVAAQVLRMPDPVSQLGGLSALNTPTTSLQRQANSLDLATGESPDVLAQIQARLGGGQPLDEQTRAYMEPRFGHHFGDVRIHTDAEAAALTHGVNARAFTLGRDVFFGAGEYQPGSDEGRRLAAHELTHVVQQRSVGAGSFAAHPLIQRQFAGSGPGGSSGASTAAQLRQNYVALICEVIADIRRGVEEGRTWYFEDEVLLQQDQQSSSDPAPGHVGRRLAVLEELVGTLDTLTQDLESGAVTPTDPANRSALRDLWRARNPESHLPHDSEMYTRYIGTRYNALGQEVNVVPAPFRYFDPPSSAPGHLRSADPPTWWVLSCHAFQPQASPPQPPVRPPLTPGWVIFISRTNGRISGWYEEPIRESYPPVISLFGPYEPHEDERSGRIYILVEGQRIYLLPNARVEIQPTP